MPTTCGCSSGRPATTTSAAASASTHPASERTRMADRLLQVGLVGGDGALERELSAAAADAGLGVVPASALDRADVLLVADGARGAALDVVRTERALRPQRPALVVGDGGELTATVAMASGARGIASRPLDAPSLRAALAAAGRFAGAAAAAPPRAARPIVLLGAVGGAGTTTCAVALAIARSGALLDLDLAAGDAAAVAAAEVRAPDALLALAFAPALGADELADQLAIGPACRVL